VEHALVLEGEAQKFSDECRELGSQLAQAAECLDHLDSIPEDDLFNRIRDLRARGRALLALAVRESCDGLDVEASEDGRSPAATIAFARKVASEVQARSSIRVRVRDLLGRVGRIAPYDGRPRPELDGIHTSAAALLEVLESSEDWFSSPEIAELAGGAHPLAQLLFLIERGEAPLEERAGRIIDLSLTLDRKLAIDAFSGKFKVSTSEDAGGTCEASPPAVAPEPPPLAVAEGEPGDGLTSLEGPVLPPKEVARTPAQEPVIPPSPPGPVRPAEATRSKSV